MDEVGQPLEWVVAVATVIALLIAAWELRANARNGGQTHAREAWMKYLELGLQYPELGSDDIAMQHFKMKTIHDLFHSKSVAVERYIWFLDIMLEACESLIDYFPTDSWKNTIKFNIRLHEKSLRHIWVDECDFYSKALCDLVDEVFSEGGANKLDATATEVSGARPGKAGIKR